jgi:hypothetical protein
VARYRTRKPTRRRAALLEEEIERDPGRSQTNARRTAGAIPVRSKWPIRQAANSLALSPAFPSRLLTAIFAGRGEARRAMSAHRQLFLARSISPPSPVKASAATRTSPRVRLATQRKPHVAAVEALSQFLEVETHQTKNHGDGTCRGCADYDSLGTWPPRHSFDAASKKTNDELVAALNASCDATTDAKRIRENNGRFLCNSPGSGRSSSTPRTAMKNMAVAVFTVDCKASCRFPATEPLEGPGVAHRIR